MDSLRGHFTDGPDLGTQDYGLPEDDMSGEAPPASIGQDERRMQVRAYNHWASLLGDRNFPPVEDLQPDKLGDFGPCSVLLDFTSGLENPGIAFLGSQLARECDADAEMERLSDVPSRSLLSRITDHYMQILANQAPIGFEAEFINQRGATILYRGILLPFSSDNDTIDFIYGVINWKELADSLATDELLLEIDQALDVDSAAVPPLIAEVSLTDWADGPAAEGMDDSALPRNTTDDDILELGTILDDDDDEDTDLDALPAPSFGHHVKPRSDGFASLADMLMPKGLREPGPQEIEMARLANSVLRDSDEEEDHGYYGDEGPFGYRQTPEVEPLDAPLHRYEDIGHQDIEETPAALGFDECDEADMGLGDWLATARQMAETARNSEDRTRHTLYAAIGKAYDFSLAATGAPAEFAELAAESGLTIQDRAPMTPVVKLVFGADYDKTRLTEYATALSHGHRLGLTRGEMGTFLSSTKGGLKAVVASERRLRRAESGKDEGESAQEKLVQKLRDLEPITFDAIEQDGSEFALIMVRRLETGEIVILGEVPEDIALLERAGRKLVE